MKHINLTFIKSHSIIRIASKISRLLCALSVQCVFVHLFSVRLISNIYRWSIKDCSVIVEKNYISSIGSAFQELFGILSALPIEDGQEPMDESSTLNSLCQWKKRTFFLLCFEWKIHETLIIHWKISAFHVYFTHCLVLNWFRKGKLSWISWNRVQNCSQIGCIQYINSITLNQWN